MDGQVQGYQRVTSHCGGGVERGCVVAGREGLSMPCVCVACFDSVCCLNIVEEREMQDFKGVATIHVDEES